MPAIPLHCSRLLPLADVGSGPLSSGGGGGSDPSEPPVNTDAPYIYGDSWVGGTLTCDPNTWTGMPSFNFQWQSSADGSTWADIGIGPEYTPQASDEGLLLQCIVTGTNEAGSASAYSGTTSPRRDTGHVAYVGYVDGATPALDNPRAPYPDAGAASQAFVEAGYADSGPALLRFVGSTASFSGSAPMAFVDVVFSSVDPAFSASFSVIGQGYNLTIDGDISGLQIVAEGAGFSNIYGQNGGNITAYTSYLPDSFLYTVQDIAIGTLHLVAPNGDDGTPGEAGFDASGANGNDASSPGENGGDGIGGGSGGGGYDGGDAGNAPNWPTAIVITNCTVDTIYADGGQGGRGGNGGNGGNANGGNGGNGGAGTDSVPGGNGGNGGSGGQGGNGANGGVGGTGCDGLIIQLHGNTVVQNAYHRPGMGGDGGTAGAGGSAAGGNAGNGGSDGGAGGGSSGSMGSYGGDGIAGSDGLKNIDGGSSGAAVIYDAATVYNDYY